MATRAFHVTGDIDADKFLAADPLALLIGMVLDQQIIMEKAFHSPYDLKQRIGESFSAGGIAAMDPDTLKEVFSTKPALHRFPGSMAARVQQVCSIIDEEYGGDTASLWKKAKTGDELMKRLTSLPGFGEQKAKIFGALLGKQFGIQPDGWIPTFAPYSSPGSYRSVADVDSPESLRKVRTFKKEMKASQHHS